MKSSIIAFIMLIGIAMSSCNNGSNKETATSVQDMRMEEANPQQLNKAKLDEVADSTTVLPPPPGVLQAGNPIADWDKKIIKTANITLELKDYKAYNTSLRNNVKSYGAYIASEEQVQNEDRIENVVTIKVPVLQFEPLINSFNGEGIKVINRRIGTEDVTGEVVDTKARIDAKKQIRARYLDLLKQAKNMQEVLQVQNEINAIQEDLETADGRVKYLVNQSAYSTVHLVYYQYLNGTTGGSASPGFVTKLKEAFENGSYIISSGLLLLVTIWPLLLIIFVSWFMVRKWRITNVSSAKKV